MTLKQALTASARQRKAAQVRTGWRAASNEQLEWVVVQVNEESYGVHTPAGNAWYESWADVVAFCQGAEREGWQPA